MQYTPIRNAFGTGLAAIVAVLAIAGTTACGGPANNGTSDNADKQQNQQSQQSQQSDGNTTTDKGAGNGTSATNNGNTGTSSNGSGTATGTNATSLTAQSTPDEIKAYVDSLQVGTDGSSDTYRSIPDVNMAETYYECSPQQGGSDLTWSTGPNAEYVRFTTGSMWTDTMPVTLQCAIDDVDMPADIISRISADQSGTWQFAQWTDDDDRSAEGQVLWNRSGAAADVVIIDIDD